MPDDVDAIKNAMLNGSIVKVKNDGDSGLGKDLQVIAKEYTSDENVFKFGYTNKGSVGYMSLLGAIADKPNYPTDVKGRYSFLKSFLYFYAVNSSAVKGRNADRFKDIAGSLLAFKGALAYREAGIPQVFDDEKKHGLLDKLKKG